MQKVFGENYFIDLDAIEKYLDMTEVNPVNLSGETEAKINLIKFELVKLLLEVVLSEDIEIDDKLGMKGSSSNTSVPFKLAFNSLLNKKLINFY
jgi:hypothetical protein